MKDKANNKTKVYQYSQKTLFINIKSDLIKKEIKALSNKVSFINLDDSKVFSYGSLNKGSIFEYYI